MIPLDKHRARLGDLLLARGVITQDQLAKALEVQQRGQRDRLLGEILVDLGYATADQVLEALAEGCGVPFAHLTPHLVDAAVRSSLPEAFIRKYGVLPLFRVRDTLTVAVPEPSNLFLIDEIAHTAGLGVQVVAATADNIYQMIEHAQTGDAAAAPAAEPSADWATSGEAALSENYESVYGHWPTEKFADLLLREAIRARAAAIHLEPEEKVLRIRWTVDGALRVVMRPPVRLAAALADAFDAMMGAGPTLPAAGLPRSARLLIDGHAVQLHKVSLGGAFGPRTLIRIVRDAEAQRPLEKLGCDFEPLARFREVLAERRGLVLIAGLASSGVTTTLYSALGALDPVHLNLCTLEATIHFNLSGVNQFSPVTCGTADVADAMARLLLHQPDVVVLDGCMNNGVVGAAVEAAMDGGLVLAQVRGLDVADAVLRLADRVRPGKLATALRAVLAQRLVRTVCPHCRSAYEPPAALRRRIADLGGPIEAYTRGRGCPACGRTGYLGRIGLFELVTVTPALRELLQAGSEADALRAAFRAAGRPSLWVDGMNKVRAGITTVEEIMAVLAGCPAERPGSAGTPRPDGRPAAPQTA
ncbi:MAG TPA: ATPase, T2SS/T4P/T4SS family [Phycisphaerae bacterium]|nr:ATPase, T2SS/T4P/T4SS family [Phycisphaerae bacterium]